MSITSRCVVCGGTKKARKFGGAYVKCDACNGTGYTKVEEILKCDAPKSKKSKGKHDEG